MGKAPEQLYRERAKRISDAIQLKIPDRVPVSVALGYFPAKYAGITCEDAYYDYNKWKLANKKAILDFEPDMYAMVQNESGKVLEALDYKQILWPGHGVSPNHGHQFIEGECMTAVEYDLFLEDPSDYVIRTYLPRTFKTLEPFKMLPPLSSALFTVGSLPISTLAMPEFANVFETLAQAARDALAWNSERNSFVEEMRELGFPARDGLTGRAPFDIVSVSLRGMHGTMLDMYRQPDKLLEACEKLLPMQIEKITSAAKTQDNTNVFIPLHRGADGFMSLKQFETFYWPTLKKLVFTLVDSGLTPLIFFEGDYTSRLEYLLQLPKGKILGHFDTSDISRVKDVLGNHMCIMGNVPPSLLQVGSSQDVKDYCKRLIDVAGKGGGFIMASRSSIDEVKPENLKAMIDFTKEYGIYG